MGKRKSDIKESGSPTYNATFLQTLLQYAVENIPESLCITDLEGNTILMNNNFRAIAGLSDTIPEYEVNLLSLLSGSGKDDLMVRHIENVASNQWSGEITFINTQKRRELLVSLKSVKCSVAGSQYLTNIISEHLDKKEQTIIETYMDMSNSLPTIALGIWHLENLNGPDGHPIFRLIALNKPAQGRISPSEIRVGRTIFECLQNPHAIEISRFFANVLITGKSMEIPRFVLDQSVQFSLAAFPLQCNCVAVSFEPIKQTEAPSELYYEMFEHFPAMCGIFQKEPDGIDYLWRQSNSMGRAQRKDSFVPPSNAKLSTLVPTFNTPQLLGAVEKLKPGQFIKILVNDWTQDMYHFCLVQGRITKLHLDYILLSLYPLSPDSIRKDQSILNRATQGTYIDDDVKDIWFFYKTVQPIDSLDSIQIEMPSIGKQVSPLPPSVILPNIGTPKLFGSMYPQPSNPTMRPSYPSQPTIFESLSVEPPIEFYKRAFYEAATGMTIVNPQGTFLTVNSALCQILGYSTEEFLTNSFVPLTHPEDVEKSMGLFRQMLSGEIHSFHMIKRYLHKHGHVVWCCISTAMVRDANNKPLFIITLISPVETWRNLIMGPDLKRDDEMQSELINEAPIGCCTISKEGIICSINRYVCDRLGYSMHDLIGKPILYLIPKEDHESTRSLINYIIKNPDAKTQSWNLTRLAGKNGKELKAFTFVLSLTDAKGATAQLSMFIQDCMAMPKAPSTQQWSTHSHWKPY